VYQLREELFFGEPVQVARRGQRLRPPVKPRVGAVLPGFLINALPRTHPVFSNIFFEVITQPFFVISIFFHYFYIYQQF
jgi:hypothetical protein